MKPFIATIKKPDQEYTETSVYTDSGEFYEKTFNPDTEIVFTLRLEISGKTYRERKEYVRNIAIMFSLNDNGGLSQGELEEIGEWFQTMGRRYGLLGEFRENGIC